MTKGKRVNPDRIRRAEPEAPRVTTEDLHMQRRDAYDRACARGYGWNFDGELFHVTQHGAKIENVEPLKTRDEAFSFLAEMFGQEEQTTSE